MKVGNKDIRSIYYSKAEIEQPPAQGSGTDHLGRALISILDCKGISHGGAMQVELVGNPFTVLGKTLEIHSLCWRRLFPEVSK